MRDITIQVSRQERADLYEGLSMKINFIQTGNPILSAKDLENMKKPPARSLSIEQMKKVVELDELRTRVIQAVPL